MIAPNLVKMILNKADGKAPDMPVLMVKKNTAYESVSWSAFLTQIRHLALGLHELGVGRGDKVALLAENRPEWAVADLAVLSLGAATVPIYTTSSAQDTLFILKDSTAKVLILSSLEHYEKLRSVLAQAENLKKVILMAPQAPAQVLTWPAVLRLGGEKEKAESGFFQQCVDRVEPEDLATIIYTSGTTGEPKGVMLTHANFLSNIEGCTKVLPIYKEENISLSFLPLSHVFERMAGYYFMIYSNVVIAYAENMNTVPANMAEVRPTVVTAVPRFYEKVHSRVIEQVNSSPALRQKIFHWAMKIGEAAAPFRKESRALPPFLALQYFFARILVLKKIRARLGGRLRFFISGGAPLSKELADFFYAAGVLILEGYGLTETSPVVTFNRPDRFKFGTVGLVIPEVEVKIAEDGEVLIKGPNIMRGYFNNPEKTREVMRDSWFCSGDIGEFDKDGFLRITDRKKDLIATSGGKKIAPQRIEGVLVSDEWINQVCVCGDKKNYLTALIVPHWHKLEAYAAERGITPANRKSLAQNQQIVDFIYRRVEEQTKEFSSYEKIKYITLLPEEFTQENGELTPTLKLKRKMVTTKYAGIIEKMYESKAAHDSPSQ